MVAIMGPSGSGKSDPDAHPRIAPRARPRRRSGTELAVDGVEVTGLSDRERTRVRATPDGLRIPAVQPRPDADRRGERGAGRGVRGRKGAQGEGDGSRGAGARRAGRPRRPPALGAVRRRAAARGDRPGAGQRPTLVLADEPTGNLDSARSAEILALLRRFNRERGQTFIIVTHDAEVGAACDRIIHMRDGVIVGEDPVVSDAVASVERLAHGPLARSSGLPLRRLGDEL